MPIFGLLILGFLGMTAAYTSYDKKSSEEKPAATDAPTPDPFSVRRAAGDEEMDPMTGNRRPGSLSRGLQTAPVLGENTVAQPPAKPSSGSSGDNPENAAYLASVKFDNRGSYEELTRQLSPGIGTSAPEIGAGSELGPQKNPTGDPSASSKGTRKGSGNGTTGLQADARTRKTSGGIWTAKAPGTEQDRVPGASDASFFSGTGAQGSRGSCPEGMANIEGKYCIDKWEATVVDHATGKPASPYFTPDPSKRWPGGAWQYDYWARKPAPAQYPMPELPDFERSPAFSPAAVSRPGVYPQGFMNKPAAELACRNAGKRLCAREEWYQACTGPQGPRAESGSFPVAFPYGNKYQAGVCNFGTAHPLTILKRSSSELNDPRLMLAESGGRRVLARTGDFAQCSNGYGVYDMVGNQDEIVADPQGGNMVFVGSFYSRAVSGTPRGCASAITSHAEAYNDYSIGFRCCADLPQ